MKKRRKWKSRGLRAATEWVQAITGFTGALWQAVPTPFKVLVLLVALVTAGMFWVLKPVTDEIRSTPLPARPGAVQTEPDLGSPGDAPRAIVPMWLGILVAGGSVLGLAALVALGKKSSAIRGAAGVVGIGAAVVAGLGVSLLGGFLAFVITYGLSAGSDIIPTGVRTTAHGLEVTYTRPAGEGHLSTHEFAMKRASVVGVIVGMGTLVVVPLLLAGAIFRGDKPRP